MKITAKQEAEKEFSVEDICGCLKENIVNGTIMEITENEFINYQSHVIGHVESDTIKEARCMYRGRPRTIEYHIETCCIYCFLFEYLFISSFIYLFKLLV